MPVVTNFVNMRYTILLMLVIAALRIAAQELQPTDTEAVLTVLVLDAEKVPRQDQKVTLLGQEDERSYQGITDANGKFQVLIPKGQKYDVKYKSFTANLNYKVLEIPDVEGLLTFDYTIHVMPPKVYTLDNVFFDTGKSSLSAESFEELNELVEYMTKKTSMVIEIAGHTDNVGDKISNQKLSEDRADKVRDYLLKKGIAPERVAANGYGDSQPVASNAEPEGRQKNRRTEVRIITP